MEKIATGRSPARLLSPAMDVLLRLGEWSRRRHVKASCGPLSDALLRDIGLIREDVEAALDMPLDQNASDKMMREAMARAGNW